MPWRLRYRLCFVNILTAQLSVLYVKLVYSSSMGGVLPPLEPVAVCRMGEVRS
jgi:hypothetical protein